MKRITLNLATLLIFFVCSSLDYPLAVKLHPVALDKNLHMDLVGGISMTAERAHFHRWRGRFDCAVFVSLENNGTGTSYLDRGDFYVLSSRGEHFTANSFHELLEHRMFSKPTTFQDHYPLAPHKRVDYVFSWTARNEEYSFKDFRKHVTGDTVYFMHRTGQKADTLAVLAFDPH